MWHTRIQSTIPEEDFIALTKYHNDSNSRECNQKRASLLGFEDDIKIAPGANVRLGEHGALGRNVFIGICSYVNGDVVLEEDVLIGPFCSLTSNSHLFNVEQLNFRGRNMNRPIRVGKGSWLSTGVAVNPGVAIGKGNLILPNSVVTKSTEDFLIIGGNPARACGRIDTKTGQLLWDSAREKLSTNDVEDKKQEISEALNGYQSWVDKEENGGNDERRGSHNSDESEKVIALESKVKSLESKLEELNRTVTKILDSIEEKDTI